MGYGQGFWDVVIGFSTRYKITHCQRVQCGVWTRILGCSHRVLYKITHCQRVQCGVWTGILGCSHRVLYEVQDNSLSESSVWGMDKDSGM